MTERTRALLAGKSEGVGQGHRRQSWHRDPVLLLLVAMGSLAWEAVHRLQSPQPIEGVTIMVMAAIGIAVNTAAALLFMRGREDDLNIRGALLHTAADALASAGVAVAGGLAPWFGWADDAFLQNATQTLHDRFDIVHVTLQAVRVSFAAPRAPRNRLAALSSSTACMIPSRAPSPAGDTTAMRPARNDPVHAVM